ncbi:hypothetical protein K466DRAFT_284358 [Polyporus arcularius HHB13444]|uniref:Uncharacterized protein n=1 Tax=Polyporus arcularius HHB13444 TaxID=1314778 RepID=A0A5C3NZJ8_9APHY|nr:hypothetical protein K466DRAFT_284358 [Polyporus arcularius HHB13444]
MHMHAGSSLCSCRVQTSSGRGRGSRALVMDPYTPIQNAPHLARQSNRPRRPVTSEVPSPMSGVRYRSMLLGEDSRFAPASRSPSSLRAVETRPAMAAFRPEEQARARMWTRAQCCMDFLTGVWHGSSVLQCMPDRLKRDCALGTTGAPISLGAAGPLLRKSRRWALLPPISEPQRGGGARGDSSRLRPPALPEDLPESRSLLAIAIAPAPAFRPD